MTSNNKGFTLFEILIALAITAVGFLAMSQMQYISLRQKTLAETGTFATNVIDTVSDFEMANARAISLLNARVYLDSQANKTILNQVQYCDGSDDSVCAQCPCNPLTVFTSPGFNLFANGSETLCVPLDIENFNISDIEYFDSVAGCSATADDLNPSFFIIRRVVNNFDGASTPNQINLNVTYALKSLKQLKDTGNGLELGDGGESGPLKITHSISLQNYQISAHVEQDWTNFVTLAGGTWNLVVVPHIP